MKKRDKGTLSVRRDEIRARHAVVKSWRKLARDEYPGVRPGTLCAVAGGYVPKTAKVLRALGLPILRPAPVCECGEVHLSARCPNRPRTPAAPRIHWKARALAAEAELARVQELISGKERR